MFTLALAGSVAHLYSLGYVYDFDLRREWLAPALWVLAWTLHLRLPDYVEALGSRVRQLTFILPLPVTLIAANETGSNVFFTLNALNLLAFAWRAWGERGNRLALHLALLTLAAVIAATPAPIFQFLTGWFNRADLIGLAAVAYVMVTTLLTRNPKAAIAGAMAAAVAGGALREYHGDAWHWAAQAGCAFFLLHSLPWSPVVVPGTALGVALCGPANALVALLQTAPVGVLALGGSLLLFALGTAGALTKHRWHKAD